jgi:hypothetical protein
MFLYELIMHVYETPELCASPAKMGREEPWLSPSVRPCFTLDSGGCEREILTHCAVCESRMLKGFIEAGW